MIITQPLEITTPEGKATGRWRLVEMSDEHDGAEPLCECGGRASDSPTTCGHESPDAARACPAAAAKVDSRSLGQMIDADTVARMVGPDIAGLARVAFDAYGASTGGKTWDGKPIPPFETIRERTPHVAKAWEDAVAAVLTELENAR